MHNSYFLLKSLSKELQSRLKGYSVVSCFSQAKDELIFEFNDTKNSFFVKAYLSSSFSCLSFPESFARARKNSVDIFPEVILKKVASVQQFENERSFMIHLADGFGLLFKMHGSRSNIILFDQTKAIKIFRNQLKEDFDIHPDRISRVLHWTFDYFNQNKMELHKTFFTLGSESWAYLKMSGFDDAPLEAKWELLYQHYMKLEKSKIYIAKYESKYSLQLFDSQAVVQELSSPIEALNIFFHLKIKTESGKNERNQALKLISEKEKGANQFILKNRTLLSSIETNYQFKLWGDAIMANLGGVSKGVEKVILPHPTLYDQFIEVKLKKDLTPIKNAEAFYRKSKNQRIEIEKLNQAIKEKETLLNILLELKIKIDSPESNIKKLLGEYGIISNQAKAEERLPYKEILFKGFIIRIGRSAADNDELTLKYAHKEDLWLHAKDVSGSHVVVKHQSGKVFPKDVIERAASLAAYHSKRKGESLCSVSYTSKKFVRKRKGDPAGLVVVEKETVILIEPMK